jgi:hypothetical protein
VQQPHVKEHVMALNIPWVGDFCLPHARPWPLADLTSCSFVYVACIGQSDVRCDVPVDDAEY